MSDNEYTPISEWPPPEDDLETKKQVHFEYLSSNDLSPRYRFYTSRSNQPRESRLKRLQSVSLKREYLKARLIQLRWCWRVGTDIMAMTSELSTQVSCPHLDRQVQRLCSPWSQKPKKAEVC